MAGASKVGSNFQRLSVIGNGSLIIFQGRTGNPTVVVYLGIIRVDLNSLSVVSNGCLRVSQFAVGNSAVVVSISIVGVNLNSLSVICYSFLIVF